jgi:type IV secretion system protein VirB4
MLGSVLKKIKIGDKDADDFDPLSNKSKEKQNYLRLDSPVPNFIPYACHYDKKTILTKNGELLQTIKIVGFTFETLGGENISLRDTVREAVTKSINSPNFSLCFHTIRKKRSLDNNPKFKTFFSQQLHEKWVKKNQWNDKYINELYVSVIHAGMSININSANAIYNTSFNFIRKQNDQNLVIASKELDYTVNKLLGTLSHYGAERLELVYDDVQGYHSELLEFFGNIIHLDESPMPLPMADLSKYLARYKIAFGNDVLEVRKNQGKFFAAIFSVKEYHELSTAAIDKFLQLNQQFVVTQTINFIDSKTAIKNFKYQDYILKLSKDYEFRKILGLDKIMDQVDRKSPVSFCESQLTIMIVAEALEKLENELLTAQRELSKIGVAMVREDLNLEHCFWSQLPGNFYYITRKSLMATISVGGFASLHNFPAGSLVSKWGSAITLMQTALGTPYFFNFHVGDIGHSIIIGNAESGKGTLLNFLLSESSKLGANILYFDSNHESELYIRATGGTYLTFDFEKTDISAKFNPLLLDDEAETRDFLKYWFLFLADKYVDTTDIEQYSKAAEKAVEKLFSLPKEKRILRNIAEFFTDNQFAEVNQKIIDRARNWYGNGKYAHIFDNSADDLIYQNDVIAIDMTKIYDSDLSLSLPIKSYLLHFFKIKFIGLPSIMAVSNINTLFNNIYFEKNLANILDDLSQRNSILVATSSFTNTVGWSPKVANVLQEKMVTKIFLPDDSGYQNVKHIFNLTEEEEMYLEALETLQHQFIIRQSGISIISELNLRGFEPDLNILSSTPDFANHCYNIMVEVGSDPNVWVPKLYEEVDEEIKLRKAKESIAVDISKS